MMRHKIILCLTLWITCSVAAQTVEWDSVPQQYDRRERATSYGIGTANVYDTYLSPQAYKGMEFRIMRESTLHKDTYMRLNNFQGSFAGVEHPSGDNQEYTINAAWRWGYAYKFPKLQKRNLEFAAGAQLYGDCGIIYNLGNGNNPVSAKLGAGIGGVALAKYKFVEPFFKEDFTLGAELFVPLAGAFFAPRYGQAYYDIFSKGDNDGVVRFSNPFATPSLWARLSLDKRIFKRTIVRFSYVADIRQSQAYNTEYHQWSNVFMLGLVYNFVRL